MKKKYTSLFICTWLASAYLMGADHEYLNKNQQYWSARLCKGIKRFSFDDIKEAMDNGADLDAKHANLLAIPKRQKHISLSRKSRSITRNNSQVSKGKKSEAEDITASAYAHHWGLLALSLALSSKENWQEADQEKLRDEMTRVRSEIMAKRLEYLGIRLKDE